MRYICIYQVNALGINIYLFYFILASSSISEIQRVGEASNYKQRIDVRTRNFTGKACGLS